MLVKTRKQFERLLKDLKGTKFAVVDTETNGLNLHDGVTCMVGIAIYIPNTDTSYYVPVKHGTGQFTTKTWDELKRKTFQNKDKKGYATQLIYDEHIKRRIENVPSEWVKELQEGMKHLETMLFHNAQFDMTVLDVSGFPIAPVILDTMVSAHLVNSWWFGSSFEMPNGKRERGNKRLKWLSRLFRLPNASDGEDTLLENCNRLSDELRTYTDKKSDDRRSVLQLDSKSHMWALPPEDVSYYAEMDVKLTHGLHNVLMEKLKGWDLVSSFYTLCAIQSEVAWRMHRTGYLVLDDELDAMSYRLMERMEKPEREWQNVTRQKLQDANVDTDALGFKDGYPSITSPKQIINYVESVHGETLESADKTTLEEYIKVYPELIHVATHRPLKKLLTSYIVKWRKGVTHHDSPVKGGALLHASYGVTGTKTGRWNSTSEITGNMQTVPRTTGDIAPKTLLRPVDRSHIMIELDYASLEMVIGAWIAEHIIKWDGELKLTEMALGGDQHTYTMEQANIMQIMYDKYGSEENALYAWGMHDLTAYDNDVARAFRKGCRQETKPVNFAMMYGGGYPSVSNALGVSEYIAKSIVSDWHKAYPSVSNAMNTLTEEGLKWRISPSGHRNGQYVRYPFKEIPFMRRYDLLPATAFTKATEDKPSKKWSPRRAEARNIFNSKVQGTGSLMMSNSLLNMVRLGNKELNLGDIYWYGSTHDSGLLSLNPNCLGILKPFINIMEDYETYPRVSVGVDASPVGEAWGMKREVKDLDLFINSKGTEGFKKSE